MKAIVTTTSQKLTEILSQNDLDTIMTGAGSAAPHGKYLLMIRNVGTNDVYVELYKDATTTEGLKITNSSGELSLSVDDLSKVNLISNGGNSELRIIVTT